MKVNTVAEKDFVKYGQIRFGNPTLDKYRWPVIEISGDEPGPRLCVMAGIHVNESSGMQAAISIPEHINNKTMRGTISILPIVNQPAEYRAMVNIPVDDVNMHWLFPGNPRASFSPALCDALLNEWAADADVVLDMHGGDYGQALTRYVVTQMTGDIERDRFHEAVARCFDTDLIVALPPEAMQNPGRCCTGLGLANRCGVVSEAGLYGAVNNSDVTWHLEGALRVAGLLEIIKYPALPRRADAKRITQYNWLISPADGFIFMKKKLRSSVFKDELIAEVRDVFSRPLFEVRAPETGIIMWHTSQILTKAGARIGAVGSW